MAYLPRSNLVQATAVVNGTNISGTIASNSISLSGLNQAYSAANGSATFQTLSFANSNGVSFSTGTQGVYATVATNYLTTARASNDAIGLNSAFTAGPLAMTINSSGLSLNASNAAGTTSGFAGNLISGSMTHNTAGLNLSLSHPAWLTTAAQSDHSHGNPTLALTNLSGTTASNSAGFTLSLSAAAPGAGGGIALANSQTTYTSGTAHLSVVGGAMTIASTTGQSFNFSVPAVSSIVGVGGITVSTNGSTVSISNSAQNPTISAGTTPHAVNSINFSNANGVTFGMGTGASSTVVTASVNAGGGARTVSTYVPFGPFSTNSQTLAANGATSASARFFPIFITDNIAFNALRVMHNLSYASSTVSGQQTVSYQYGLFSDNAGTLSSISSGSLSIGVTGSSVSNTVSYPASTGTGGYSYATLTATATAQIQSLWGTAAGGRPLDLQFGDSMTLSSGVYWLGVNLRHSSSSAPIGVVIAIGGNVNAMWNNVAPWGVATTAQTTNSAYRNPYKGLGAYTVSVSSLPNGVPLTQIAQTLTIMPLVSFLST